ncbi:MAG: ArsR family transcriptional regulator [Acidobacteria bacterium]|nr:ArsR family transcriptional regulator [Acidobacteriota bacterium]
MLQALFGNPNIERVLWYIDFFEQGYATAIAKTYGVPLNPILNALDRLEKGSILDSFLVGKTRVYRFNPRWVFLKELHPLLEKSRNALPQDEYDRYFKVRRRPRRKGKPLDFPGDIVN